jgi:hypothetical protein
MNDKQLADQIVVRAQGEVASRRAAGRERRWHGRWPWLLPTLALAVLVAFLAAPLSLPPSRAAPGRMASTAAVSPSTSTSNVA